MNILLLELQNVAYMMRTKTLAENDESEAYDSVFQIDHLLGRNAVK